MFPLMRRLAGTMKDRARNITNCEVLRTTRNADITMMTTDVTITDTTAGNLLRLDGVRSLVRVKPLDELLPETR